MTTRRVKTYSGESGYVYEYSFLESRARRGLWGKTGTVFSFSVSSNRKTAVLVEVTVEEAALAAWSKAHGRDLTDTEKYAVAKMRLFRAFDESETPDALRHVRVDPTNIEALLEPLKLD
jgi:hypothetical protein